MKVWKRFLKKDFDCQNEGKKQIFFEFFKESWKITNPLGGKIKKMQVFKIGFCRQSNHLFVYAESKIIHK